MYNKKNTDKTKDAIPVNVIKRLPVYYRSLSSLLSRGIERVSSKKLAAKVGVTASQIRQDLNHFGNFGQSGYGYKVDNLYHEIGKIMGIDTVKEMVLIGAGNLGRAIIQYPNFKKRGFNFKAIFDRDQEIIGTKINEVSVLSIDNLEDYLKTNDIDIGVITTPAKVAEDIARILVENGVRGIWNFAPTTFDFNNEVIVENVHISESLFSLSCKMNENYL